MFLKSVMMILDILLIFDICMLTSNHTPSNFKHEHVFKRFLSSVHDSVPFCFFLFLIQAFFKNFYFPVFCGLMVSKIVKRTDLSAIMPKSPK
ncbi:hypothetical protein ELI_3837 [Eubacterium callanderi]|uniref:Uncharacterized protein n=1 Tax=Eubacterium callanderi TaxID=53442 RepID=E3GGH9_9FIRM|nr:hypothetical protein ELI_3837 [Eubacterium callanderi]